MNSIIVGNLPEAARVLPEAMNNGNSILRICRRELGMVQPDIGQLGRQILFLNHIAILLKLSEEVISLHLW